MHKVIVFLWTYVVNGLLLVALFGGKMWSNFKTNKVKINIWNLIVQIGLLWWPSA